MILYAGVATRYGLEAFRELSGKFPKAGVSKDLIRSREGMKEVIEAIAFSLHILEKRKVAEYKDRDPSPTAAQIKEFRESVRQEIGRQYSGEEFACPDGTYENLQGILKRIRSGESFESLLVHAKRAFAENFASDMVDKLARGDEHGEQSVHIVPYIINTIADAWGLKAKDGMEDIYSGTYDRFINSFIDGPRAFIEYFYRELGQKLDSESFTRVIAESLSNGIMGKITMGLPNFTEYESPEDGGWINVEANFGAVQDRQDDYVADALSVFAKFGIDKYFGEDNDAQKASIRTVLFKNTLSSDYTKMKVEVRYNDFLKFASFACMYKMASYDPSLITGVSKKVFQVPLRVHKQLMQQDPDTPPSIDLSVVLDGFEPNSMDMELALYEMVCAALDSGAKIRKDGSLQAPMDYLLKLGDASASEALIRVLRRYMNSHFTTVNGIPHLPVLMGIAGHGDAIELLYLCSAFRDNRTEYLGKVLQAASLLKRIQTPEYAYQDGDFSSLKLLLRHYSIDEIKPMLPPELEQRFMEYLVEDAIALVAENGYALAHLAPWLRRNDRVVLAAVGQDGIALKFADASLKRNERVVLAAVGKDGLALEFAHAPLQEDLDVVLAAVKQNGLALEFAHESLKRNEEVALAAVRQDWRALEFLDDSLKRNEEVALAAVRQDWRALEFLDDSLKRNEKVVLAAVKQNWCALDYADESLMGNKEIFLAAVRQSTAALEYADEDLKKDEDVALVALVNDPYCLWRIHDDLRIKENQAELLDYLKTKIIGGLPEQYKNSARGLLDTGAYISSEIPFILEEPSFSDVFKMEWIQNTPTSRGLIGDPLASISEDSVDLLGSADALMDPLGSAEDSAYVASYRDNLSKLLAVKVILHLCNGDIHNEKFAQLCKQSNIARLSADIHSGLKDLSIEALKEIFYRIEETADKYAAAPAVRSDPSVARASLSLTQFIEQFVHDTLSSSDVGDASMLSHATTPTASTASVQREHGGIVIPRIDSSSEFFRSFTEDSGASESLPLQV